jgi:hypothetical protein
MRLSLSMAKSEHQALLVEAYLVIPRSLYAALVEKLADLDNRVHLGRTPEGKRCAVLFTANRDPVGFLPDEYNGPG